MICKRTPKKLHPREELERISRMSCKRVACDSKTEKMVHLKKELQKRQKKKF